MIPPCRKVPASHAMLFNDPPKDVHNDAEWFHHFRMTAHLPAMADKFDAALNTHQTDPAATRAIMTGYAATALDVLIHIATPPKDIAAGLAENFRLTPQHFLLLKTDDFSRISGRGSLPLHETMSAAGFLIDRGTVVGFRPPSDGRRPPRIPRPSGP